MGWDYHATPTSRSKAIETLAIDLNQFINEAREPEALATPQVFGLEVRWGLRGGTECFTYAPTAYAEEWKAAEP